MEKNVKGIVGLISALLAFVLIIVAFVPMTPLKDINISFYGGINTAVALVAVLLSLVAIVAGAMSVKHKDKKGPRKAGIIVGVLTLIISLISWGMLSAATVLTDYVNGTNQELTNSMTQEEKESLDNLLEQLKEAAKQD